MWHRAAGRPLIRGLLVVLLTVLNADCAGTPDERTSVGSPTIVTATVPGIADSTDVRWTARERLSIGTDSGAVAEEFTLIGAVDVDASGAIYVLDLGARQVRKFDRTGAFLAAFGTVGGGPGEFAAGPAGFPGGIGGMAVVGDSILVLQDPWDWTLVIFDLDGTARPDVRLALAPPERFVARSAVALSDAGDGSVVLHFRNPFGIGPARAPSDGTERVVRVGLDGKSVDSLLAYPITHEVVAPLDHRRAEILRRPFAARFTWAVSREGVVATTTGERFGIELTDRQGRMRRLEYDAPRRAVTREDAERFRRDFPFGDGRADLAPDVRAAVDSVLHTFTIPDSLPAIDELRFDRSGRLWVRRYPSPAAPTARWDVFDQALRFVAHVQLPRDLRVRSISEDEVVGTMRDVNDVPYVKVLSFSAQPTPR